MGVHGCSVGGVHGCSVEWVTFMGVHSWGGIHRCSVGVVFSG